MDKFWKRTSQFIDKFETHALGCNPEEDGEFFDTWEIEMAKALLNDASDSAVRIAKVILAHKDIAKISIKVE